MKNVRCMKKLLLNWGLEMTVKNKKWETRKFTVKERKTSVYDTAEKLCRVVPPRLAGIPNISIWLLKQRKTRVSLRIGFELDKVYAELASLLKES
ncbi:hypothetical protein HOT65_gp042 [Salmonella phage S133]|uniref:Uncharacterized protein n=2 Tax=Epseptimavirus TaxID=2732017 RepID=A0A2Z5HP17_9CAUD|nr:hypothetical protein HOT60_gp042 [Salmonella phage S114]YP_009805770.1 hypothetical protein HOT65_gp042 [Salmonella phage S133]AXC40229.1 hypothetical protein [Salmonella phage S114]AXC41961.1 hypothetical protein [Salmonella phage S133]